MGSRDAEKLAQLQTAALLAFRLFLATEEQLSLLVTILANKLKKRHRFPHSIEKKKADGELRLPKNSTDTSARMIPSQLGPTEDFAGDDHFSHVRGIGEHRNQIVGQIHFGDFRDFFFLPAERAKLVVKSFLQMRF